MFYVDNLGKIPIILKCELIRRITSMTHISKQSADELLEFALEMAKKCGTTAMEYYGRGDPDVKFDDGLITEAEIAILGSAKESLSTLSPKPVLYGEGEIGTSYKHGGGGYLWVIDPIDGTASFQAGIPVWGISIALFENFWPIFGVFYMPVTEELYWAKEGGAAYKNSSKISIGESHEIDNESLLLTYSRFHRDFRSTFPGKIRNLGSAAAHIMYVASGKAEGALFRNVSFKDLAAAQIILKAAGGEIVFLNGQTFHLNEYLDGRKINDPLIAVPRGEHRYISGYIH